MPAFFTRTADMRSALQSAIQPCGAAAHIKSSGGLDTVELRLGDSAAHSVDAEDPTSAVRAMLLFGEHARELVSPELSLTLLRDLCAVVHRRSSQNGAVASAADPQRFAGLSLASASPRYSEAIEYLAAAPLALHVVPLANPWGRQRVENGDFCRRTNEAGVDLNRNWDSHWLAEDQHTGADSRPGPAPFSEGETQAVRAVLLEARPHMFLSVHSGTEGMYTPPAFASDDVAQLAVREPRRAAEVTAMRQLLHQVLDEEQQAWQGGSGASKQAGQRKQPRVVTVSSSAAANPARFAQQALEAAADAQEAAAAAAASGAVSGEHTEQQRKQVRQRRLHAPAAQSQVQMQVHAQAHAHSVPVGGAAQEVGYPCPGTCLDYSSENARVPYAFAFEIYGTPTVPLRSTKATTSSSSSSSSSSGVRFAEASLADAASHDEASSAAEAASSQGVAQTAGRSQSQSQSLARFREMRGDAAPFSAEAAAASSLFNELGGGLAPMLELSSAGRAAVIDGLEGQSQGQDQGQVQGASGIGMAALLELEEREEADAPAEAIADADADEDASVDAEEQLHEVTVGSCFLDVSSAARALRGMRAARAHAHAAAVRRSRRSHAAALASAQADADASSSSSSFMTASECLAFFNPTDEGAFRETLAVWADRTARLMQLVHARVVQERSHGKTHA